MRGFVFAWGGITHFPMILLHFHLNPKWLSPMGGLKGFRQNILLLLLLSKRSLKVSNILCVLFFLMSFSYRFLLL